MNEEGPLKFAIRFSQLMEKYGFEPPLLGEPWPIGLPKLLNFIDWLDLKLEERQSLD